VLTLSKPLTFVLEVLLLLSYSSRRDQISLSVPKAIKHDLLQQQRRMPLTAAQTTAFFEAPAQMGITHPTEIQLQDEGISTVDDLVQVCCARDGFKISNEKETLRKIPTRVRSKNDESLNYI
jgi:hypothetical protein